MFMAKTKNLSTIFLILAVAVLVIGIVATIITSVPVFQAEQPKEGVAKAPLATSTGLVTVNVIPKGQ